MKVFLILIIAIIITGGLIAFNFNRPTPMPTHQSSPLIRPPAVAGQFYPDDPAELKRMINEFLDNAETQNLSGQPQILIVPHAGYVFSGQTAAYGYKTLISQNYNTVIVIGPSHNYPISGLVLYDGDAVKTPLGDISVNRELVRQLTQNPNIIINNQIHAPEHCLEVQLPFSQTVLTNNWQVVLGLVSTDDLSALAAIADVLSQVLNNNLLIISSDLSHYPSYDNANYSDQTILKSILTKQPQKFNQTKTEIMSKNLPGLDTCACGGAGIKIGMLAADKLNLSGQILHYANSGDTKFGDKNRVVGYGAVVFNKQEAGNKKQEIKIENTADKYLNSQEQSLALALARNTLKLEFNLTDEKFDDYKNYPIFSEKRGAFVTLNKQGMLRGCIGLIEPIKPLGEAIIEMTVAAALDDPRFNPVTADELDQIDIEISVLTPPQLISDYHQIKLGQHGVIARQGSRSGVFLPQVAADTGWTLDEFLSHLCADKAGLNPTCCQDATTQIYIFEAQVFEEADKR